MKSLYARLNETLQNLVTPKALVFAMLQRLSKQKPKVGYQLAGSVTNQRVVCQTKQNLANSKELIK